MKNILNIIKSFFKKLLNKFLKLKPLFRIITVAVAVLLVAAIVVGIVFGSRAVSLKSAFNYKKGAYTHAQIQVTRKITTFDLGFDTTVSDGTDFGTTTETEQDDEEYTETRTIQIYNDEYLETTDSAEIYIYKQNGKEYVAAYDSVYGEKTDKSAWTVSESSNTDSYKSFSFSGLKDINVKNLNYKSGEYTPEFEFLDTYFAKIHNLNDLELPLYVVDSFKIKVKNGKIRKITYNYIFNGEQSICETLTFKYKNEKLSAPNFS